MGAAGQGDIFDDLLCRFDGELFSSTVSAVVQQGAWAQARCACWPMPAPVLRAPASHVQTSSAVSPSCLHMPADQGMCALPCRTSCPWTWSC